MTKRDMAHRDIPLCVLPNGRTVRESDLDYTPGERTRVVIAWAVVSFVVIFFALLVSLA